MNRGNIYASTADVLAKTNIEEVMKSAKKFATNLSTQDMLGIFTFYILLPLGFIYTIAFPLPLWFEIYSKGWLIRVFPLLLCIFNVYFNAWRMVKNGANSPDGSLLPSIQKSGFRFCHECQMNAPPRSFHCPVCNVCILRRDHHCSFVGCCVGHFNQRYFIASITNLWPITFACFIWNISKMFEAFPAIGFLEIWKLMFPHVALAFRFIGFNQFLMVAAFALSLIAFFFTTYLISAQFFCFSQGQTRVEYLLDIHAYDLGLWENISQGLGRKWLLALFCPFVDSPPKSDGLSFRTRERESIGKNTKTF